MQAELISINIIKHPSGKLAISRVYEYNGYIFGILKALKN